MVQTKDITVAQMMLETGTVTTATEEVYPLTSGRFSPIYCNLKILLDRPDFRSRIADMLAQKVRAYTNVNEIDLVVGVPFGGIPWATLVADRLDKRLGYVDRMGGFEGRMLVGDKAILIEDVVTTGGSLDDTAELLYNSGIDPLKAFTIFSYRELNFNNSPMENAHSLCTVNTLLKLGVEQASIPERNERAVRKWLIKNFEEYGPRRIVKPTEEYI